MKETQLKEKEQAFKKVCESGQFFEYDLEDLANGLCFCLDDGVHYPTYVFTTNKNLKKANYTTREVLHLIHLKDDSDQDFLDKPLNKDLKKDKIKSQIEFDGIKQVTIYENLGTDISEIVVDMDACNIWIFISSNYFEIHYRRFNYFCVVVLLGA